MTISRYVFVALGFLACLSTFPSQGSAQQAVPAPFDSPRATMFTFLRGVNGADSGSVAARDSAVATLNLDPELASRADEFADMLRFSLDRIRRIEEEELPAAGGLSPSRASYRYFPDLRNEEDLDILRRINDGDIDVGGAVIEFERLADGRWLFSARTMMTIHDLSNAIAVLPPLVDPSAQSSETPVWVQRLLPPALQRPGFLGLRLWQWVGLFAAIFLGLVADMIVRAVLRPIVLRLFSRLKVRTDATMVRDGVRAVGIFAAAIIWASAARIIFTTPPLDVFASAATGVFAVLVGTWAGWKLVDMLGQVLSSRAERTESKFDDILIPLLRKTAKVFLTALGIVYGAGNMNIDIVPLLTGLGIGGLAFAFAAKDTIENLFGSVAVVLDRPFEVGDWIVIGDIEGTVEELGFRSTRVRTFYNSLVTVPNAALVRATVDNYGRRQYRRWKTYLGVQYDTTPAQLIAFTEGIRELVRQHPYTRKDYFQVWCNDFADSSLNILLYVFHEVPDWSTELRERERLLIDIVRLADQLGVQFAFPTQTVHLYKEEHGSTTVRHEIPMGSADEQARKQGAASALSITESQPWQMSRPGPVTYEFPEVRRTERIDGGDG